MFKAIRKHHISFKNAFAGIVWAVKTQPNFRVHMVLSALALSLSWYLGISNVEKSIILFAILLGLTSELINTAIESVTDLVTKEWRQEAKIAKDVSAGMMLLVAFGAVLIALYIFTPYLTARFGLL